MDELKLFNTIPSSLFYSKKKGRLPPPPQVSDGSDDSDDEENFTLIQNKTKTQTLLEYDESHDDDDDEDNMTLQHIQNEILHTRSQSSMSKNANTSRDEPPTKKKKKVPDIQFSWTKEDITKLNRDTNFYPNHDQEVLTPLQYFSNLFSIDIMTNIIDQTNIYSTQQTGTCIATNAKEMTDFISIMLMMGIINLPSYEDYWASRTRIEQIASLMSVKRFKALRRNIHFSNNEDVNEDTKDRYFKIRPLIDSLRQNFRKYHTENDYSIDETMVAYKGTRAGNLRQYIKNKPHKWGYKFFVIAGVSGYILDFIPYQGATTFETLQGSINELTEAEIDMGFDATIVIALSKSLHESNKSILFFDNYFSGLPLLMYLKEKLGIYSLGTMRSNRIAGCPIETDKVLEKQGRGTFGYKSDIDKGLIIVKWVDNKVVLLGSTLFGIEPVDIVKRYNKAAKAKVDVPCPAIVKQYNKHMGGVDAANALMGYYKTPHKSKRWYFAIFAYLLDVSVVNAWLLYRMDCNAKKNKYMPLKYFRLEIVAGLARCCKESRKGRPNSSNTETPTIQRPIVERPDLASRTDCYGHWPVHTNKGRCRHCAKGTSRLKCEKCDCRLCLTDLKNCFIAFHLNTNH